MSTIILKDQMVLTLDGSGNLASVQLILAQNTAADGPEHRLY